MSEAPVGEVWFEFVRIGHSVKVSAIHVATDTEVCIVGPASAAQEGLKAAALRKLINVLGKRPL
jgi:hypothetical protein